MKVTKTVKVGTRDGLPVFEDQAVSTEEFFAAIARGFNGAQATQVIRRMKTRVVLEGIYRVRIPTQGHFTVKAGA